MLIMKLANFVNAPLVPKDRREIVGVIATDKEQKVVTGGEGRLDSGARPMNLKDECE
jgi:hypothetical protein